MRIAILGAGAWGTALSISLGARHAIRLWSRDPEQARRIHYGESPERKIRGVATVQEVTELRDEGIDVVGGCPHLDPDPRSATRYFVALANETGLPLDLHTDENLNTASNDLEDLADALQELGRPVHVTASHCVSLSLRERDEQMRIARKVVNNKKVDPPAARINASAAETTARVWSAPPGSGSTRGTYSIACFA